MKKDKGELRKEYLQVRDFISEQSRNLKNDKIFKKIISLKDFITSDTLFTYVSMGSEVDTIKIIEFSLLMGKKVAVPKVQSKPVMNFHIINDLSQLKKNNMGILEPKEEDIIFPDENSLFLVPGLVFDERKYRIGYGGGFYDCYFNNHKKGIKCGVCFKEQIVDRLDFFEFDIPVDYIITD